MTVEVEAEGEKEHHELAEPLADLLGMRHESRANILQALFTYIRLHKLQVGRLLCTECCRLVVDRSDVQDELVSNMPCHHLRATGRW